METVSQIVFRVKRAGKNCLPGHLVLIACSLVKNGFTLNSPVSFDFDSPECSVEQTISKPIDNQVKHRKLPWLFTGEVQNIILYKIFVPYMLWLLTTV